jgi:hypothetical protein
LISFGNIHQILSEQKESVFQVVILNAKPLKTEAWACDLENDSEKKGRYDMVIYG